jgi:DNA-binding response OmpR family regulator
MASDDDPDFVARDLRLPRLSGLELLASVRTNPKMTDIPVIILSNVGDTEMHKRVSNLGVFEFMIKAQTTTGQLSARIAEHERWTRQGS